MKAFHNDQSIKDKYLKRVEAHAAADAIIQGTGWENGKGCAVGCTLESYDHSRYPIELGIPEWLAQVEDTLFEGMSVEHAKQWPARFLAAIPVGANLEAVKAPFMCMVLKSALATQEGNNKFDEAANPAVVKSIEGSKEVIKQSLALWERGDIGSHEWKVAARSAAESAESARSAAWSAWSAARPESAWSAWSARSAELAARSESAESARSAARSESAWSARSAELAARSAKYEYFADELINMLKNCPPLDMGE